VSQIKVLTWVLSLSILAAASAMADEPQLTFGGPLLGLGTARDGDLLVADSGLGVIEVEHGQIERTIVLPGVSDVSPIRHDALWAIVGGQPVGRDSGQGLYLLSAGSSTKIANLFEFEQANNPDGASAPFESNPFRVQSLGGFGALITDAAANDLLLVDYRGNVRVLAIFPTELTSTANIKALAGCPSASPFCSFPDMMSTQAVPTGVAIGRDGYIYVGELKGLPAPTGKSAVWRVSPFAHWAQCGSSPDCVKVFDSFTSIIDVAAGPDGNLYVVEMDEGSWAAVRVFNKPLGGTINACNVRTQRCREVATHVPVPTAITFGKDGSLWATENALTPGGAEVVRIGHPHPHW